ncbi:MAG: helix-turn-helix transcriptional regulator [Acidimicrobiales bacterium]
MNRLERLYALNEEIRRRSPEPVSASVLAETFGVSRRTIERDLVSLRSAGVPLYAEAGRKGGQRSADRSGHVVLTLSTAEISALLIALAAAGEGMPFVDAGVTATKRLLDGLPDTQRVAVDDLRHRIRTAVEEHGAGSSRVRRTLEEAVRRSVVVNLDYVDRNDKRTTRAVDAVGFYKGSDGWHLIGWCHLRDAGRIFLLSRVQSARITRVRSQDRSVTDTLGWVPHDLLVP